VYDVFNEASHLADYKYATEEGQSSCSVVVDCGYSFTHLVPFVNGKKVDEFILRIDVGGKALTNFLKEIISYRYTCKNLKSEITSESSNYSILFLCVIDNFMF
jgi:actin-related protein